MDLKIQTPKPVNVEVLNNELKIDNNTKVYRGYSAYEIAVQNGFKGTEEEWLASLEGQDGYTPVKGIDYFTESDKEEIVDEIMDEGVVIDLNYVHTDNNYTREEKEKLASLQNYDDTEIKEYIDNIVGDIETVLTSIDTGSGV